MVESVVMRKLTPLVDKTIRKVYTVGHRETDERGNNVIAVHGLTLEITSDDNTYPKFLEIGKPIADKFADGLTDKDEAWKVEQAFAYAYGYRIRTQGNLQRAIDHLQECPATRRCTIPIWDYNDLRRVQDGEEVPCATQFMLDINRGGELDATLIMRSNDVVNAMATDIYGFRKLQKYVAERIGRPVGCYRQYTNNAHIILENSEDFIDWLLSTPLHWY